MMKSYMCVCFFLYSRNYCGCFEKGRERVRVLESFWTKMTEEMCVIGVFTICCEEQRHLIVCCSAQCAWLIIALPDKSNLIFYLHSVLFL